MKTNILAFYGHNNPKKGFLSQFYPCSFSCEGLEFNCSEQFMMAGKAILFGDKETFDLIIKETDPFKIKSYGRLIKNFNSEKWDQEKQSIVTLGNTLKFSQDRKLLQRLLDTYGQYLVEATPTDLIWGNGLSIEETEGRMINDWPGQNLLGEILMDVRELLLAK